MAGLGSEGAPSGTGQRRAERAPCNVSGQCLYWGVMKTRIAPGFLWLMTLFALCLLLGVIGLALQNESGHTGWEPRLLLLIFTPLLLAGLLTFRRDEAASALVWPVRTASLIGLLGVLLIGYLDRTNSLVQYERWLERGMPEKGPSAEGASL